MATKPARSTDAKLAAVRGACRDLEHNGARGRRHFHAGTECCFPGRHGQIEIEVLHTRQLGETAAAEVPEHLVVVVARDQVQPRPTASARVPNRRGPPILTGSARRGMPGRNGQSCPVATSPTVLPHAPAPTTSGPNQNRTQPKATLSPRARCRARAAAARPARRPRRTWARWLCAGAMRPERSTSASGR